jgi:hypothetical protein
MASLKWNPLAQLAHVEWAVSIHIELGFTASQTYLLDNNKVERHLQSFPLEGKAVPTQARPNLRRVVSHLGYSIFYEVDDPLSPQRE